MPYLDHEFDRRRFLQGSTAASVLLMASRPAWSKDATRGKPKICAFIKFVQSYKYGELAERVADAGFDGIEATVRKGGYIEPKDAKERLPKLVEALRKHGLEITILCSDVLSVDQPHAGTLLRTASDLGIKRYRMGFYHYDLNRPILEQLDAIAPALEKLTTLNGELGLQAVYQNHSGTNFVGGPIWDIHRLIEKMPVDHMAMAFDIRHATIEGGLSWPVQYKLIRPHLGAVFVKDFDWDGPKDRHVPLGKGRVDPKFFRMLRDDGYSGPYSLHVEYLGSKGADDNMRALKADLATLRTWLAS